MDMGLGWVVIELKILVGFASAIVVLIGQTIHLVWKAMLTRLDKAEARCRLEKDRLHERISYLEHREAMRDNYPKRSKGDA